MTAEELFREGRLGEAIAAQTAAVKAKPLDADGRFFLFLLLCFSGELDRAEAQLEAAVVQKDELQMGSIVYRSLLGSELERRKVYREGVAPVFPPEAPHSLSLRHRALRELSAGDAETARATLDEAEAQGVELVGKLDGSAFDGLRDYDDVLGQVLEVYTGGRYLWLPLEQVRKISVQAPKSHIDLLWVSAEIEDTDGRTVNTYIPALYEGSHEHADEQVRLGRSTEWVDCGGAALRGAGQRTLFSVCGDEERETPFLELRTLEIERGAD
jgi:type VI secretion system protein ImpE